MTGSSQRSVHEEPFAASVIPTLERRCFFAHLANTAAIENGGSSTAATIETHQRVAALRKSDGVAPVAFLNAVLKC